MDKKISAAKQKKIEAVKVLEEKAGKATSVILTEYKGIKHKQLEELRKTLKKADAEILVSKNRLVKRALGDKAAAIDDAFNQQTAVLFTYKDQVAPLKELLKFFKAVGLGKAKAGLLGADALDEKAIEKLSTLPSREVLLGKLVGQLMAPLSGLHYSLSWNINRLVWALSAVKDKKN